MKPEELLARMEREEQIRQANADKMRQKILNEGFIPPPEGNPGGVILWLLVALISVAGWIIALVLWALLKLGGG